MNHQSLINEAPKLVAFGLRTGLLSVKPQPTTDPYLLQQREKSKQCMKQLRERMSKVSEIES